MGTGIIVCGLNGCGKSTFGKALAERLRFRFIDNEDLYFPKTNPDYAYASPRSPAEASQRLKNEISMYGNFVLAAVKGEYVEDMRQYYDVAIVLEVPRDVRLARVQSRSFQQFGARMLPGGDLHAHEASFLSMVETRPERYVEEWLQSVHCPILRLDGTSPVEDNVMLVREWFHEVMTHSGGGIAVAKTMRSPSEGRE